MVRSENEAAAVELAKRILGLADEKGFPLARVGLDTGPAVERNCGWFRSTVNTGAGEWSTRVLREGPERRAGSAARGANDRLTVVVDPRQRAIPFGPLAGWPVTPVFSTLAAGRPSLHARDSRYERARSGCGA